MTSTVPRHPSEFPEDLCTFYRGQNVVVTGGAGFIGSHLAELLRAVGANVRVLDTLDTHIPHRILYSRIDVGDLEVTRRAFANVSIVFNLAARVGGVFYNQSHHLLMFHDNMRVQVAPVRAAVEASVRHFLQVSSVCVYAPDYTSPCYESNGHLGVPSATNGGYAYAKRLGERAVWWADWGAQQRAVIVRPTNVYGPRDNFDPKLSHVVPALIHKCLTEDTIEVMGDGRESREFLYVEDAAYGMMTALARGKHQEVYNLGTHAETLVTIRELVSLIQTATNTEHKPVVYRPHEGAASDAARWSDCGKMQALDWTHTVGLVAGLQHAVDWYQHLMAGAGQAH